MTNRDGLGHTEEHAKNSGLSGNSLDSPREGGRKGFSCISGKIFLNSFEFFMGNFATGIALFSDVQSVMA
jgi:hypothetical protein